MFECGGASVPGSTTLVAAVLAAGYAVLLLILARHEQRVAGARRWLLVTLLVALAGAAVNMLPADAHTDAQYESLFVGELTQPGLAIIIANLTLVLFGMHLLRYLQLRMVALWAVSGLAWWGAQAATSLTTENLSIGLSGWYRKIYDPVEWPNVLAAGGWLVLGVVLILAALYAFYRARLSEIANQALFGVLLIPLVVMGVILGASGADILTELGWITLFLGLVATVYGMVVYRVFDIRRAARRAAYSGILTVLTALLVFAALIAAQEMDPDTDGIYALLGAMALGVAVFYLPLRALAQTLGGRIVGASPEHSAQLLRQYSEDIAGAVELDTVVDVTMKTLTQVLGVRRGALLVVNNNDEAPQPELLAIEPLRPSMGDLPDVQGHLARSSPLYTELYTLRNAVLQYDLDFSPTYTDISAEERALFKQIRMSAYAPVIVQGHLVGILCSGSKASDDAFTDQDLQLLLTIANQVGVALRNARLVTDLRRREAEQGELNKELSKAKERSEQLDSVKTDFITIASHELRTPLAQIRGYTDIMEAMNEQGMLEQDQIGGMTSNLRKAADRLENLIGAMLDVSQLDINAMDLRFSQTSVENVMRMAIEPLTEAITNRKLMLSARGLRNLPPIQADMQRLVQAFRNVVLNAIKFTPDGGRIDISGEQQGDYIHVMIKDSGIGIAPENQELVFEKFFRAHDPSLHSTGATKFMGAGPGLGLTIARGVVSAHGGRIWVDSPGFDMESLPGSTFFIELPLTPPDEARRVSPFESTVSLSGPAASTGTVAQETSTIQPPGEKAATTDTLPHPPAGLRTS